MFKRQLAHRLLLPIEDLRDMRPDGLLAPSLLSGVLPRMLGYLSLHMWCRILSVAKFPVLLPALFPFPPELALALPVARPGGFFCGEIVLPTSFLTSMSIEC